MLSQSVGYAAMALGTIAAAAPRPLLVKDIAESCDIPAAYLAKLINALARKGIVATQRGIGGGVTLARDPKVLTLLELCEAMDDPITKLKCFLGNAQCSDERSCPAHKFWTAHRSKALAFLRETTVADIAAFDTNRRAGLLGGQSSTGLSISVPKGVGPPVKS